MSKGSASIFSHEFVVDGIRYRAIPDSKAGYISRKLHDIFAPFKGHKSSLGKGAEATKEGRQAIGRYIYLPTTGYAKAKDYMNRLGTGSESYWSSWFFGRAYGHNPEYRKLNTVGRYLSGYPHSAGMRNRWAIEKNPNAYIGKTEYVMFSFKEAPVDVGDSIIAINRTNPHTFEKFKQHGEQMASHGRVVARVSGGRALLHGGNESGGVGKDELPLKDGKFAQLDELGRLVHPGGPNRYTGILKKVEVLGPNTAGVIAKSYAGKAVKVTGYSALFLGLVYGGLEIYKRQTGQDLITDLKGKLGSRSQYSIELTKPNGAKLIVNSIQEVADELLKASSEWEKKAEITNIRDLIALKIDDPSRDSGVFTYPESGNVIFYWRHTSSPDVVNIMDRRQALGLKAEPLTKEEVDVYLSNNPKGALDLITKAARARRQLDLGFDRMSIYELARIMQNPITGHSMERNVLSTFGMVFLNGLQEWSRQNL